MAEEKRRLLNKLGPAYFRQQMVERKYNEYTLNFMLPYLKGNKMLELGCGDGLWTETLTKMYSKVVVVDASEPLLKQLRNRLGERVTCYCSLVEEFETDEKFDTILAVRILEHLDEPVKILRKFRACLSNEGRFIIVVPNAFSLHRRIGRIMGLLECEDSFSEADSSMGHKRIYRKESLLKDIELSGLRIEAWGGIGLKPLSNSQMESWSEPLLNAFFEIGKELPPELCGQLYAISKR